MVQPVFSFGEKSKDASDQWYTHKDGIRVSCNEETIDYLWWQYIMNPTAKRADKDGYNIFTVSDPPMNLNK